jgi:hypothetical protein
VSSVTSTELGYVSGVTSAIQTQINAKQATITGGATTITGSNLTASRVLVSDGSGKVAAASTTSTTLGYLDVGSSLTTLLGGKEATISAGTTAQYWRGDKSWQTLNSSAVGLGNVDNTSDANKPVSTAQQTALDLKRNSSDRQFSMVGSVLTSTSTTVADITNIKITMGANEEWSFYCLIHSGCNNTGGISYGHSRPTGCTALIKLFGSTTGVTAYNSQVTASPTPPPIKWNTVNSQGGWIDISGTVLNGANAGDFQLQYAAGVAGQTATIDAETFIVAWRH